MDVIINKIYDIIWSDALVYLCLLTGIYFTVRFSLPAAYADKRNGAIAI
ncbi:hypothetical protein [Sphingobacterium multivorum]|nr:hypothetical protein [Sphingobacterium multivorum]